MKTVQRFCFVCRKRYQKDARVVARQPLHWRDFCSNECKGVAKQKTFRPQPTGYGT